MVPEMDSNSDQEKSTVSNQEREFCDQENEFGNVFEQMMEENKQEEEEGLDQESMAQPPEAEAEAEAEANSAIRVCDFCGRTFGSGKALGGHRRFHFQALRKLKQLDPPQKKVKIRLPKKPKPNSDHHHHHDDDMKLHTLIIPENSGKPSCCLCKKDFPSKKSLFGHMRSHPEREWRGVIPPINSSASSIPEEEEEENNGRTVSASAPNGLDVIDLLEFCTPSWLKKDKRGRRCIGGAEAALNLVFLSKGIRSESENSESQLEEGAILMEEVKSKSPKKRKIDDNDDESSGKNHGREMKVHKKRGSLGSKDEDSVGESETDHKAFSESGYGGNSVRMDDHEEEENKKKGKKLLLKSPKQRRNGDDDDPSNRKKNVKEMKVYKKRGFGSKTGQDIAGKYGYNGGFSVSGYVVNLENIDNIEEEKDNGGRKAFSESGYCENPVKMDNEEEEKVKESGKKRKKKKNSKMKSKEKPESEDKDLLIKTLKESAPNSYKCSFCGKSFSTFQALGGHRSRHNNKEKMKKNTSPDQNVMETRVIYGEEFASTSAPIFSEEEEEEATPGEELEGLESSYNVQELRSEARIALDFDLNEPYVSN